MEGAQTRRLQLRKRCALLIRGLPPRVQEQLRAVPKSQKVRARSPRPALLPEDALGPAGTVGTPPKAEATCQWALPYTAGSTGSAASLVVTERPRALSSFKKVPYLLVLAGLQRRALFPSLRDARVHCSDVWCRHKLKECGLLVVGRPWPESIFAVTSQNSPQLKSGRCH